MSDTVNVLIVFYSRNGSTAVLAEAIASGAREAGAEVTLRRVDEFISDELIRSVPGWSESRQRLKARFQAPTPEDAENADAIIFGTPTRFGNCSAELKSYIDSLGALWAKGALNGKVGSAFVSTATMHGGNEVTTFTLFAPMAHLGMIIVPPGYADPVMFEAGTPYGASAVTGQENTPPTDADLDAARHQGRRVAHVAAALKAARPSG
jgi:NAD(P)H dehydrogenase (quinone)